MEQTQGNLISPGPEVPVLEGQVVTAGRGLLVRWGCQGDRARAGGHAQYGATVYARSRRGSPVAARHRNR
jgi:hypothetical protein